MKKIISITNAHLPDALIMVGAGSISFGAWLCYRPAGYLVAGALCILGGWMLAKGSK